MATTKLLSKDENQKENGHGKAHKSRIGKGISSQTGESEWSKQEGDSDQPRRKREFHGHLQIEKPGLKGAEGRIVLDGGFHQPKLKFVLASTGENATSPRKLSRTGSSWIAHATRQKNNLKCCRTEI